jgi:acyl carrier protein
MVSAVPDNLTSRLITVIAATLRIPAEQVSAAQSLSDLGIQSLERLNLLFAIEDEFNVVIEDEEAQSIQDLRGLAAVIERLVAERPAGAAAQPKIDR